MRSKKERDKIIKEALEVANKTEGVWTVQKKRQVMLLKEDLDKINRRKKCKR